MRLASRPLVIPSALLALLVLAAPRVVAQGPVTDTGSLALTVSAGVSQYDLSGTGNAVHGAVRMLRPIGSAVLFEAGSGITRIAPSTGESSWLLIPEVQLQAQLVSGRFAPYVGAGGGAALAFGGGDSDAELTLSVGAGVRVAVAPAIALGAELRVRGIGTGFEGSTAEWTAGVAWRP
jgi:hypothetical protein